MPLYLVSFSDRLTNYAAEVRTALRHRHATELWKGVWLVDLEEGPEVSLPYLLNTEAAFAVALDAPGPFVFLGRATEPEARLLFAEKAAALLIEPDASGERLATVRYCNDGEAVLGPAVARYRSQLDASAATTDLCRVMAAQGSDKGVGWHSYTPFYAALFAEMSQPVRALFEVGIGTNNEDVPSNMGAYGTPGASLRGWRNYFPDARIYGGDVDRRILFAEDRIETFFLDQLAPATMTALWSVIPHIGFDVFIDDGLHTFEAASATFKTSIHKINQGGLYIIEDVERDHLDQYLAMIETNGLDGLSVDIRHGINGGDNCLVVGKVQ